MSDQPPLAEADLRTALTLLVGSLGRVDTSLEKAVERLSAIEVRQEGTRVELAGINRRLDIGNERMDVANHRTSKNEARIEALEDQLALRAENAKGRREQREELKARAFGLVRALDNKYVTAAVLAGLVACGAALQWAWPW